MLPSSLKSAFSGWTVWATRFVTPANQSKYLESHLKFQDL